MDLENEIRDNIGLVNSSFYVSQCKLNISAHVKKNALIAENIYSEANYH